MLTPRWPLLLWVGAAALACAHVQDQSAVEELDHDVDLYWKAMHWQDAIAGAAFVTTDQRTEWLRVRDKAEKSLSITSWEIQGEKLDRAGQAATALVKITWFKLPSTVEETDLVEQRWVHVAGHWLAASEKGGPLPFP